MIVVDRVLAHPKDVHVLIPGTRDCVDLPGKKEFTDVIRLKMLR